MIMIRSKNNNAAAATTTAPRTRWTISCAAYASRQLASHRHDNNLPLSCVASCGTPSRPPCPCSTRVEASRNKKWPAPLAMTDPLNLDDRAESSVLDAFHNTLSLPVSAIESAEHT